MTLTVNETRPKPVTLETGHAAPHRVTRPMGPVEAHLWLIGQVILATATLVIVLR